MESMTKQWPDKQHVIVIDGAPTHRPFGPGFRDPSSGKMRFTEATEEKPVTLKAWLEELGLWNEGYSYTRKGKGGKKLKMRRAEAEELLRQSAAFLAQRMAVEELGRKFGVLVVFLPCAHPMLNPIEKLWRMMKNMVRRLNGPTKEDLGKLIDEVL